MLILSFFSFDHFDFKSPARESITGRGVARAVRHLLSFFEGCLSMLADVTAVAAVAAVVSTSHLPITVITINLYRFKGMIEDEDHSILIAEAIGIATRQSINKAPPILPSLVGLRRFNVAAEDDGNIIKIPTAMMILADKVHPRAGLFLFPL